MAAHYIHIRIYTIPRRHIQLCCALCFCFFLSFFLSVMRVVNSKQEFMCIHVRTYVRVCVCIHTHVHDCHCVLQTCRCVLSERVHIIMCDLCKQVLISRHNKRCWLLACTLQITCAIRTNLHTIIMPTT